MRPIARLCLALLCLLSAGSAVAYTPTTSDCWLANTSPTRGCFSSPAASFADWLAFYNEGTTEPYTSPTCISGCGTSGETWRATRTTFPTSVTNIQGKSGTFQTCPNGGALSGGDCVCTAPEVDTGSACEAPQCPAVGQVVGTRNITTGWATSPTMNGADTVVDTPSAEVYGEHCLSDGTNYCPMKVNVAAGSAAINGCWRSQQPSDNGLYRESCDYVMVSTGTSTCTPSTSSPSHPSSAAPPCPTGNVGDVNGRPVCLGSMPASGINFGQPEKAGNPRAGTSAGADNATREPTAGAGGGPDARGGPGVTVGPDGSVGTGSNRTTTGTGAGGAQQQQLPTDYQRDNTGQTTNQKLQTIITDGLKIKEDGTPDGTDALKGATDAYKASATEREGYLEDVVSPTGKNTEWTWTLEFPTTCSPLEVDMTFGSVGEVLTLDPCEFIDVIHDLMSMIWAGATLWLVVSMFGRTLRGT